MKKVVLAVMILIVACSTDQPKESNITPAVLKSWQAKDSTVATYVTEEIDAGAWVNGLAHHGYFYHIKLGRSDWQRSVDIWVHGRLGKHLEDSGIPVITSNRPNQKESNKAREKTRKYTNEALKCFADIEGLYKKTPQD